MEEIVTSVPFWIEFAGLCFLGFLITVLVHRKTSKEPTGTVVFFLAGWTGTSCYFLSQLIENATLNPWLAPAVLISAWALGLVAVVAALLWFLSALAFLDFDP